MLTSVTDYSRAEVLRDDEDDPNSTGKDIGGDMNHIHRVAVQLLCKVSSGGNCYKSVATVIVKTAPDVVLVCKTIVYNEPM